MIKSDATDLLFAALVAIQAEVGTIPKTSTNPFFKSKYADLATAKEIADPIATKHGVAVVQFPAPGDRLLSIAVHTSGQYMGEYMDLHPIKSDPQSGGSAMTYGRRYAYFAVLGLVADEDDDGAAASRSTTNTNGSSSSLVDEPLAPSAGNTDPGKLLTRAGKLPSAKKQTLADWALSELLPPKPIQMSEEERVKYLTKLEELEAA